jgi:putative flippase GtrA
MKVIRYFFVGGFAALIDITLFAVFAKLLGYSYLIVSASTFIIATSINYILSVKFVFKSGVRFSKRTEVSLIFAVSLLGLIINQFAIYFFYELLGIDLVVAKIFTTFMVFFWSYFSRSMIVFNIKKGSND